MPAAAEVRILEPGRDGLDQILSHVHTQGVFRAIHILSHGSPGRLVLGSGVVTHETLDDRAFDFVRLGRALCQGGDLLLYGCNLAQGPEGRAFVARLAELTGADVAASETLTGAEALGGNWRLEVEHGLVQTRPLEVCGYEGVFTAPTIQGPSSVSFTEGGSPALIQGVALQNGLGYAGGSLRISVSGATADDRLVLTNDADPNIAGAISVSGSVVYLGNGSGRDAIGTVDATANGQNGQDLLIHFTAQDTAVVTNPSFESGVTGWTVGESRVILGTTVINGRTAPADPTSPANAGGDGDAVTGMTYDSELSAAEHTDGAASLRLFNNGNTQNGFDVVHGPYAYSNTFTAQAGDTFHFDWQAKAGQDAYDAFGYLMNADTGEYIIVINETGANDTGVKNWTTGSVTVPDDGDYFFVFVAGTYDFTGGKAVGGSLFIDNFRVEASLVTDDVIEAITANVAYENTADDPPAGPRNLTVTVTDGVGDDASASGQVTVTNVNDGLTGGVTVTGSAQQGAILTASNDISDPDGDGPVTYQWQREDTPGNWTNINGATGTTYQIAQADVGKAVRAVGNYTDGGGQAESFTSNPTAVVAEAQLPPAGGVQVTGDAEQGEILAAANTLSDPDGMGTVGYQWQREDTPGNWVNINGATGSTYQLAQADVGKAVRAVASYTDGDGHAESVASGPTAAIANANDVATGAVTVTGDPEQGEVLTASNNLADPDGMGAVTYHWQREDTPGNWVSINGATSATYQLTQSDVGKAVRAVASYTDGAGTAETATSAPTAAVANVDENPTGGVTVNGVAEQGQILTASNNLADPDGMGAVTYQWQREDTPGNWVDIGGATGNTYELAQADVGKAVRAVARYTDGGGSAEAVASGPTSAVSDTQSNHTGGVQVTGDPEQGDVLTAANTLADPDGMGAVGYQWQREDTPGNWININGATGATYQLAQADVGKAVRAVGSYTDGDGHPESATSTPTAAVANVNDAPGGTVTIAGQPYIGATLQAGNSLTDPDGLGVITYQWQADGVDINGATGSSLVLNSNLLGKQITVVASYVDGGGRAESAESAPTTAVGEAPSSPPSTPPASNETIDGMTVGSETRSNPDGSTSQVISIPVVPPSRQEIVGENSVADIPLVKDGSGSTQLLAQVPTGLGLEVSGTGPAEPVGDARTDLIREIRAHTAPGSEDQNQLTGGGSGFLDALSNETNLLVRTVTPTAPWGASAPGEPLTLAGDADGPQTALVIDASGAPAGAALSLQHVEFAAVIGGLKVTGDAGDQSVWGDGASQQIALGDGADLLHGGGGDDYVQGNAGNDSVNGGAGADMAYGGQGEDQVFGGAGSDRLFGDRGSDSVQGNDGKDTVNGGDGADVLFGGKEQDRLFGDADDDLQFGDLGDDFVQGNRGADTLSGGLGNDLLHGGQDDDVLRGDDGIDWLSGDFGDDVLYGGSGADVFMSFGAGTGVGFGPLGVDRVMDFNAAEGDRIYIEPGSSYRLVQEGADAVVDFGGGNRLVLVGVQLPSSEGWIIGG